MSVGMGGLSGFIQQDSFWDGEGDSWLARNSSLPVSPTRQILAEWCNPFGEKINSILEIGAGSGRPLEFICGQLDASGVGIEPASMAVEGCSGDRNRLNRLKNVTMVRGVASALPFDDSCFDMVIFGEVLFWIDRSLLYRAVAEADRVLKDGGFLVVDDFDDCLPRRNPYHHRPGLYTFKADYPSIFTASNHYSLVAKHSYGFSHWSEGFRLEASPGERCAISLMLKDIRSGYVWKG